MSRTEEFVGRRVIEIADFDGKGTNRYSMWLRTEEPIVRCRDCKLYTPETLRFSDGDEGSSADLVPFCDYMRRETQPDGFCAWGESSGE